MNNLVNDILNNINNSTQPEFKNPQKVKDFQKEIRQKTGLKKQDIVSLAHKHFGIDKKNINAALNLLRGLTDSVNYNSYNNELFENDEKNNKTEKQVLEDLLAKDLIKVFKFTKNSLSTKIISIIENDPSNWYIITNSRERMNKLKQDADTEINAKIELICRTANSGRSDLGDKFKAALSTHPIRATSLKGIWSKYSDDLNDRIESRIRSISGDNGNSNILGTIKEFLMVVYPNLIALLLYYKQFFYILDKYTSEQPLKRMTDEQQQNKNRMDNENIRQTINKFKNDNQD